MNRKTGKMFVRDQAGKGLTSWRQDIIRAALVARGINPDDAPDEDGLVGTMGWIAREPIKTIETACSLQIQILLPRPASVTVRKRPLPCVKPDLDKMTRAIMDGLKEAGVYRDDALVVKFLVIKQYAGDTPELAPGAWITVSDQLD